MLSQTTEGIPVELISERIDYWILWAIQEAAKKLDHQIRAAVSSLLFEDLRNIIGIIQMNLL